MIFINRQWLTGAKFKGTGCIASSCLPAVFFSSRRWRWRVWDEVCFLRALVRFAFVVPSVILQELSWRCCVYCKGAAVASQRCKIHSLQRRRPHHAHMFSFEVIWNWDSYGKYRFWSKPIVQFFFRVLTCDSDKHPHRGDGILCFDWWSRQFFSFSAWLICALKRPSETNRLPLSMSQQARCLRREWRRGGTGKPWERLGTFLWRLNESIGRACLIFCPRWPRKGVPRVRSPKRSSLPCRQPTKISGPSWLTFR